MRIVPDSNILISALLWQGPPARLMESALRGEVELYLSQPIIETMRVFRRKGLDQAQLAEALEYITAAATIVTPTEKLNVVETDEDDNKILECAVAANADVIVSGDKHLLRLKKYGGISIIKVSELLRREHGR